MARTTKALTDTTVKSAKAKEKAYTLSDGQGLQLLIKPNGTKLWEFRFNSPTILKRRKTSLGTYPTVSLSVARIERLKYLQMIQEGIDPIDFANQEKEKIKEEQEKEKYTIEFVIDRYYDVEQHNKQLKDDTVTLAKNRLTNHFLTHLPNGKLTPIIDIGYNETIKALESLETKGKLETLNRVKRIIINVFQFAYNEGYIQDIEFFTKLSLKRFKLNTKTKNNPTLTKEKDIKELYNKMLIYPKSLIVRNLLLFSIHTAQRQGSIITARWEHINFEAKEWFIPKENMKGNTTKAKEHTVPLTDSTIKILRELKKLSTSSEYVFPNSQMGSTRNKNPHTSNNTVTNALRVMEYTKEQQTAHGFRAMFKTVIKEHQEEHNLNNEFVEKVLSHKVEGEVEATYNRAKSIKDMRKVLDWWSNYLEGLKDG
jgi:integrase